MTPKLYHISVMMSVTTWIYLQNQVSVLCMAITTEHKLIAIGIIHTQNIVIGISESCDDTSCSSCYILETCESDDNTIPYYTSDELTSEIKALFDLSDDTKLFRTQLQVGRGQIL